VSPSLHARNIADLNPKPRLSSTNARKKPKDGGFIESLT
jgi:hypothetical protein